MKWKTSTLLLVAIEVVVLTGTTAFASDTGFLFALLAKPRNYTKESFAYPVGTALNTTIACQGWLSGWKADAGLTTNLAATVTNITSGSLTSDAFTSRGLSASVNKFESDITFDLSMWRKLPKTIEWSSSSVTYIRALVQWSGNHKSTTSHLGFYLDDKKTRFGFTGDGITDNKLRLNIRNGSSTDQNGTTLYDSGITYMLVAKIETVPGGNDTISLAIFEPNDVLPEIEPVWDLTLSANRSDTTSTLGCTAKVYSPDKTGLFDELFIGETWDEVTTPVVDPLIIWLESMDLALSKMNGVKALYDAGEYSQAREVWRDLVLADLRKTPMGEFGWHSSKQTSLMRAYGDLLVGAMTEADYLNLDGVTLLDLWNVRGVPGTLTNANWLAEGNTYSDDEMAAFKAFIPLGFQYWNDNSNAIYAAKWFEIAGDFSRNCYNAINPLSSAEKEAYPYLQWNTDKLSALRQAWRVENIFKTLALITKSVPGGTIASNWMDSLEARVDVPPGGSYNSFPAKQMADITDSLIQDHSIALKDLYLVEGTSPNQQFAGLYALLLTSRFLDMFHHVQSEIRPQANAAMYDFVTTKIYPDGGMLEQSFNYNEGDALQMEELLEIFVNESNLWTGTMRTNVDLFWRMEWALREVTFSVPQVGNHRRDLAPEVWVSSAIKNDWTQSQTNDYPAPGLLEQQINNAYNDSSGTTPAFTSIAFPYAGYYAQRSGWTTDDMALFFMGGRPQRGHKMHDKNGIQLSAFGRDLLPSGGTQTYDTQGDLPDGVVGYLSEDSSAKVNTILVDDESQNRENEVQQIFTNTIAARWHTSDHFDLVEGLHTQGYGDETHVNHHRQSIFVKEAGAWVLIDNLLSSDPDNHTYRQVWNFQPYKTDDDDVPVYGFLENEITVDETNHCIHTTDNDTSDTPNIWLYSFGEAVTYSKYFGSTNPVYGWYARSIGDGIPAVDVHVRFSGTGDRQLVTLIKPVKGLSSGITSLTDVTSSVTHGFDCVTDSGVTLNVRSTLTSGTTLTAGGVSAEALGLLITTVNGVVRGIVLDAENFSAGSLNATQLGGKSFEFSVNGNGDVLRKDILIPQDFNWVENGEVIVPEYGNGTNDWFISN